MYSLASIIDLTEKKLLSLYYYLFLFFIVLIFSIKNISLKNHIAPLPKSHHSNIF